MELFPAKDLAQRDFYRGKIEDNKKAISSAIDTLDKLVIMPKGKELLAKIKEQRAKFVASFTQVDRLLEENRRAEAENLLSTETLPVLEVLQVSVSELVDFEKELVQSRAHDVSQLVHRATIVMIAVGIAALLISIGLAYLITRSITRPLHQAVDVASAVASGDLTRHIDVTSRDETGQLLQALKTMNDGLSRLVEPGAQRHRHGVDRIRADCRRDI